MKKTQAKAPECDFQDQIKRRIEHILLEDGYRPTRTTQDDITFKSEGWCCYYDFDPGDPTFSRFLLPRMHDLLDGEVEMAQTLANDLNRRFKAAKVYTTDDGGVCISVEFFVDNNSELSSSVVARQIDVAMTVAGAFRSGIASLREEVLDERRHAVAH